MSNQLMDASLPEIKFTLEEINAILSLLSCLDRLSLVHSSIYDKLRDARGVPPK